MASPLTFIGPSPLKEQLTRRRKGHPMLWVCRILGGGLALFFLLAVATFVAYRVPGGEWVLSPMSRVFPVSAMRINGERIRYYEYVSMRDGWQALFALLGQDLAGESIDERVQTLIIRDTLFRQMFLEESMELDQKQVDQLAQESLEDFERLGITESILQDRTGWSPQEFRRVVIEPLAYGLQLDDVVYDMPSLQASTRAAAEARYNEIIRLAFRVTEDGGSVKDVFLQKEPDVKQQLSLYPPEVSQALRQLETNMITPVIEQAWSFDVYAVLARDEDMFLTRRVSIPKANVGDVLREREASSDIQVLVR